jgi:hypothetical protein
MGLLQFWGVLEDLGIFLFFLEIFFISINELSDLIF